MNNVRPLILAFQCFAMSAFSATYYVSTNGSGDGSSLTNTWSLQTALTNVSAGDNVWVMPGTYVPTTTNIYSRNELSWLVTVSGVTNNLITFRSYDSYNLPLIDQEWRFGTTKFLQFRDLRFTDSKKGLHTSIPGFTNGPWLHFEGALGSSTHNEWVNCVFDDTHNLFSGVTCGDSVRGCVAWNVGWSVLEHLVYEQGRDFHGNICGWQSGDALNQNTGRSVSIRDNIFFGTGQITGGTDGRDIMLNDYGVVAFNYFYNTPASAAFTSVRFNSGGIYSNNVSASDTPIYVNSGQTVSAFNNTMHENSTVADYVVFGGGNGVTLTISNNHYTARPGRTVKFETNNVQFTFPQWQALGRDAGSTSTNGVYPPDSVHVITNADEAKRANIAVYNWSGAHNVTVANLPLVAGDRYHLYSAQNYLAGALRSGTYNGTNISIPMTNLSVAPILSGTNVNTYGQTPQSPPLTSPTFGSFVIRKQQNVTTLINHLTVGPAPL